VTKNATLRCVRLAVVQAIAEDTLGGQSLAALCIQFLKPKNFLVGECQKKMARQVWGVTGQGKVNSLL